jgi:hypothetical protein
VDGKAAHAGPAHSSHSTSSLTRAEATDRPKAEATHAPAQIPPAKTTSPSIQKNRAGKLSVDDF